MVTACQSCKYHANYKVNYQVQCRDRISTEQSTVKPHRANALHNIQPHLHNKAHILAKGIIVHLPIH